jgi:hypothetical protein
MTPVMPDFVSPGLSYRHTQASAVESLAELGIPSSKIFFRYDGSAKFGRDGRIANAGLVVGQFPEPGADLSETGRIVLTVTGFGTFFDLPFGLRVDATALERISTTGLLAVFDSELPRFTWWRHTAPFLFDIGPDRPEANQRWLQLFGMEPGVWPAKQHFFLCCLLPSLHKVAGTEQGIRLVLRRLMGVEVAEVLFLPDYCEIRDDDRNILPGRDETGNPLSPARNMRLGSDFMLGKRLKNNRLCDIRIGPMTLTEWQDLKSADGARRLRQALNLCMPLGLSFRLRYLVGNPDADITLRNAEKNSVLGINTHLKHHSLREPAGKADRRYS